MTDSWLASLAAATPEEQAATIADMSEEDADILFHDWSAYARENQRTPPGDWHGWLIKSGRGWGKTRVGAEVTREMVNDEKCAGRVALVGRTAADVRDVMVEGESGILSVFPTRQRPKYEPSKRRITFHNGAIATCFSADEPDLLRGPQHGFAWADELASWRYPETWDMMMMGLRLGIHPRVAVTTTPRPIKIIRALMKDPLFIVTTGSTYENKANLAATFLSSIVKKYEGTRLGRQELEAELLEDTPGALWTLALIDETRIDRAPDEMSRIVVSIDPAASSNEDSDETGITVCGKRMDDKGDEHGYVLEDASGRYSPGEWASIAIRLMHKWGADRIVAEVNNGGEMVGHTLRTVDNSVPFKSLHASRGKVARAEPVAALYEQKKVHHVGVFAEMESQMTTYVPNVTGMPRVASPDRMDSVVWGLTELMLGENSIPRVRAL